MTHANPQIQAQLDELATLCCQQLAGHHGESAERVEPLLKSLLMSGYKPKDPPSFKIELESRIKSQCGEKASHRGGSLSSLSDQIGAKLIEMMRWHTKSPDGLSPNQSSPPKAANISSATTA